MSVQLNGDSKFIDSLSYLTNLINISSSTSIILNEDNDIIFASDIILKILNINSVNDVIGKKLGETFNCVNFDLNENGCGYSKHCRYCDLLNTIVESRQKKEKILKYASILTEKNSMLHTFEIKVIATPFNLKKHNYIIMNISDASFELKVKDLEKIFYHDFANKIGIINGLSNSILSIRDNENELKNVLNTITITSKELLDELYIQKKIREAERQDISKNVNPMSTEETASILINQFKNLDIAKNKEIILDKDFKNTVLNTDFRVLSRVLTNMMKNALEASKIGDEIYIGCEEREQKIVFWIKNRGYMDEMCQFKIFKKRFSTKGVNRGLGTHSIKLLTEYYLNGKAYFKSSKDEDTTFFIEIDKDLEKSKNRNL